MKGKEEMIPGFTLLEVMVAMAILAIGLTALYSSLSRTVSVADISDFTAASAHLGATQMAAVLEGDDLSTSSAGDFGGRYSGYTWQVKTREAGMTNDRAAELIPEGPAGFLQRVDLIITDTRRDEVFTMTRYRFGESTQ